MQIAIFGASGFLGHNLASYILKTTDWDVRAVSPSPKIFAIDPLNKHFVSLVGDVTDNKSLLASLKGVDVAYYFVHFMGHKHVNFYEAELAAAHTFARAAKQCSVGRIVYMGGLGKDEATQSLHLASRHRTGDALREQAPLVIELRASMIIGSGSVAYDIITNLVKRLPIMLLPKAANTHTQPIGLHDALKYLVAAAKIHVTDHQIIDIGGPEVLSYAAIYREYAAWSGRRRIILRVPFIPPWLEGKFLNLFTPTVHARIGRAMVDSMTSEMIVQNELARRLFPNIIPEDITKAFAVAELTASSYE